MYCLNVQLSFPLDCRQAFKQIPGANSMCIAREHHGHQVPLPKIELPFSAPQRMAALGN